jgi:putative polyhydroxyalkanoate system protein
MADLHILRKHTLGLAQARKIAFTWAEQVEDNFGMACTYEEGKTLDEVGFTRSGVSGTLQVTQDTFELRAKLGFLLGAFKDKIEGEIVKNLDALLAPQVAGKTAGKTTGKVVDKAADKAVDKAAGKKAPASKK